MDRQDYINSVNLNRDTDFPYLVLDIIDANSYPRNPGFQVMHWHEDLQFIYVLSGTISVVTLDARVRVGPGEGVFINKNVVHLVEKPAVCHYRSFVFPDWLLKFYPGSPAGPLVERLAGNEALPLCRFSQREEDRQVLARLRTLSELEEHRTPLYAYEVLTTLCGLWLEFSRAADAPQALPEKNVVGERMAVFLRYIEQHYPQPISLDALAASAHVSKSECLRCFRASLQTAPYRYLMEYRLCRAAELLRHTQLPVGEIAAAVGFGQPSHFGKCFREKTGLSPGAYRRGAAV